MRNTPIGLCVLLFALISSAAVFCADDFFGQAIKGFRYPEYDQQGQLKMEIAGDRAYMLQNGIIKITGLKMAFYEEGKKAMHITTPLCFYDRVKRTAVSTTEVCISRSEIVITGRGFDWDEKNGRIRINNNTKVILEKTVQRNQPAETTPDEARADIGSNANYTAITSSRLSFDQKASTAVFEGNVVVTDPSLKIESDRLTVFFSNDKKVEVIEADGDVVITRSAITASAQKATYGVENGKITLSGKPLVTRDQDRLTAETIVFWRDSDRILCEPNAHLIIYSEQNMRGQTGKN